MPEAAVPRLLAADEPHPVTVEHVRGASPFFLTCDHAGRLIPRRLGKLGLPDSELERHIAWDIGILGVSRRMADALDATLISQIYSRLVIDCNRDFGVPSSICEISELTEVPGNLGLTPNDRSARQTEIFAPYHAEIVRALDARMRSGQLTVLVAMHSFTPVFKGVSRPWHIGVLYNRHPAFSRMLLELLRAEGDLVVGDNEPYFISDTTDYTVPIHGERRGLPHVEIEIRQDLIAGEEGQKAWSDRLVRLLPEAYRRLQGNAGGQA
jgi:predicted N-formylglutamate amidohydrolase